MRQPARRDADARRSGLVRSVAGGMSDVDAVCEIAEGWFGTEEERKEDVTFAFWRTLERLDIEFTDEAAPGVRLRKG